MNEPARQRAGWQAVSVIERHWRVQCECGYTVEDLTETQAHRFASQHDDEGHETNVRHRYWCAVCQAELTDADRHICGVAG
jgi:hypothetical protein